MKLLILNPGRVPKTKDDITRFSEVLGYYLNTELSRHMTVTSMVVPEFTDDSKLIDWFHGLDTTPFDAVLAMGLRYFSTVPRQCGEALKGKMAGRGFVCQIHDGSRLDNDPVDVTFTLKDDSARYPFESPADRYVRHHAYNQSVGWAADPEVNVPSQDDRVLRILVDHTNYGDNPTDSTQEVLEDVRRFVISGIWKDRWESVSVRRFDSGRVVDVDMSQPIDRIRRYDRNRTMPFTEISQEHGQAHIFCVTHPESLGLVVLETAMAGALPVVPVGALTLDRLSTVRHISYSVNIPWDQVLASIDPAASRAIALENSWSRVARRIRDGLRLRHKICGITAGGQG